MKILMIVLFAFFAYGKAKRLIEWLDENDNTSVGGRAGIAIGIMINVAFIGYGIFFWSWV